MSASGEGSSSNPGPAPRQSNCPVSNWPLHVDTEESGEENEPLPNSDSLHELPMGVAYARMLRNRAKKQSLGPFSSGEPINAVKGSKQYLYDANGREYLDCVNAAAHVGHCHPQVVSAGQSQLGKLSIAQGFQSQLLNSYVKELVSTMPDTLSVCYLCNSGSEANDLGIRLARKFTGNHDILVHDETYYGNLGVLVDISPKVHSQKGQNYKRKEWVRILRLPDRYRGKFRMDDMAKNDLEESNNIMDQYLQDALEQLDHMKSKGIRLAALVMDPFLVIPGLYKPSKTYMRTLFAAVRQMGGLVIMDEVQTGLGRMGEHMWGFQHFGVLPDIVTVGKPLGSGHPIGAVFCSREASETLGGYFSTFGGNPVSCMIGMATIGIIFNEKLILSSENVGRMHGNELRGIMRRFPDLLGDVRGQGLLWTLEFIVSKESRRPNPRLARSVLFGMKSKRILVSLSGKFRHIILFAPPLCFTITNSRSFCSALEEVLSECSKSPVLTSLVQPEVGSSAGPSAEPSPGPSSGPSVADRKRFNPEDEAEEYIESTSDESISDKDCEQISKEEAAKRARLEVEEYEQMD